MPQTTSTNIQSSSFWKKIESINLNSCLELLTELKLKGYKISPWIENIVKINGYKFNNNKSPIYLVRKKLQDFGFDKATQLKDIYAAVEQNGYELVTPEIAMFTRTLYDEQPTGEWLRFATPFDAMVDSDGVPHLPKLGKALGSFFIETYWAYPGAIFHPHNEFVFVGK